MTKRALAAAVRLRGNPRLLLRRQRGLDQLPQQRFGQIGRDAQPLGRVAAAQDDLPLAPEIARRAPGGALDGRHLLAQRLAARHQFQQLAVEIGQRRSQFIQIHHVKSPNAVPCTATAIASAARLPFS